MTLDEKLKQRLIFEIERIISKCQIYFNRNTESIWFVNPETKFWYFEYSLDGDLWWRYTGFSIFKDLYQMDDKTFDDIISEWVEDTLNCKVFTTMKKYTNSTFTVEETLKCEVIKTGTFKRNSPKRVEEVLKCEVLESNPVYINVNQLIGETLKCEVLTIEPYEPFNEVNTDKIINESQII